MKKAIRKIWNFLNKFLTLLLSVAIPLSIIKAISCRFTDGPAAAANADHYLIIAILLFTYFIYNKVSDNKKTLDEARMRREEISRES